MRLLKENIRETLWNHGLGRDFFDVTNSPIHRGFPAVVQQVKNQTAVAQVAAEVQVRSLAGGSALTDLVLPQLQHWLQLWLRFNPWPGTSTCCQCGHEKKKRRSTNHRRKYCCIGLYQSQECLTFENSVKGQIEPQTERQYLQITNLIKDLYPEDIQKQSSIIRKQTPQ